MERGLRGARLEFGQEMLFVVRPWCLCPDKSAFGRVVGPEAQWERGGGRTAGEELQTLPGTAFEHFTAESSRNAVKSVWN